VADVARQASTLTAEPSRRDEATAQLRDLERRHRVPSLVVCERVAYPPSLAAADLTRWHALWTEPQTLVIVPDHRVPTSQPTEHDRRSNRAKKPDTPSPPPLWLKPIPSALATFKPHDAPPVALNDHRVCCCIDPRASPTGVRQELQGG
jgi:hypothetical protein